MRNRKKQFAVIGLGRFGASLARHLTLLGHEVLAADRDEALVHAVAPHVAQAVQADAAEEAALREMDLARFDAAVVAIGSNIRDSILVTVLCRETGVPMVVAKAVDDLHGKILRKVGADRIVLPEQDMGMRVAKSLDTPNILELMDLSGDYRIAELIVPAAWCGRTMAEVHVRRRFGVNVIGLRREGQFMPSPDAETAFIAGDVLLVLGRTGDVERIR